MRHWIAGILLTCLMSLSLNGPAEAQSVEIEGVISSQMEAFKADDFERAFTFASPSIRQIFRTPDNFGRMVSQGYPMVWRPAEIKYLELREIRGQLVQKVMVTDGQGGVHVLDYAMIQTDMGWKINGVQILEAPDLSA